MRPQADLRAALIGFGLPLLFVLGTFTAALLMWVLAPKRFRAARLLLCLPALGAIVGFPVGFFVEIRPGFWVKAQYGAITALWLGSSCTTFFMVIGFVILGIASLVKAASSGSDPATARQGGSSEADSTRRRRGGQDDPTS